MVRFIFSFLFLLFCYQVSGQNDSGIAQGSSHYILDEFPSFLDLEESLMSGEWDFTKAAADRVITNKKIDSKEIEIPFYGKSIIENGQIKAIFLSKILGSYINRYVTLKDPIKINEIEEGSSTTEFSVVLGQDELENSLVQKFPIYPDSIRIVHHISYTNQEIRDVQLKHQKDFETAILINRKFEVAQKIDLKISPFDWEDLENIDPNTQLNETHLFDHYIFKVSNHPMPTAIIQKENDKVELALLKTNGKEEKLRISGNPTMRAIPNPVINEVRFELKNLEIGDYRIRLKNILGQTEMVEIIRYTSPDSFLFNLGNLRKGSYFYILEDSLGNVISTKRLIVIRP